MTKSLRASRPNRWLLIPLAVALVFASCSRPGRSSAGALSHPASGTSGVGAPFVFSRDLAQRNLDSIVSEFGAPAAVFAISEHGGPPVILTSGTWGTPPSPTRPDDAFFVASVTKVFVGALALALVDDGKIDLDAPINHYGLAWPNGDEITVRELLTHTSGIPPLGGDGRVGGGPYEVQFDAFLAQHHGRRVDPQQVLDLVRARPLLFPPGSKTSYSNVDTILAAQVVERVTDETWAKALHDRILGPLHLDATRVIPDDSAPPRTIPQDGTSEDLALISALGASGQMVSNAADLIAFGRAFLRDGSFLRPQTHQLAATIAAGGTGAGTVGWGRPNGLCLLTSDGCPPGNIFFAYGGSGSMPGVRSILLFNHDNDTVIVAFAANESAPADGMAPLTWFNREFNRS